MKEDEIPKILKSFPAIFGVPESVQKRAKDWFQEMLKEKKIDVIVC